MGDCPALTRSYVGDRQDEVYDRAEYKYNRQSERIELKDQNETVHQYDYDKLGRPLTDKVTLPQNSPIDDAVLRIAQSYALAGQLETVNSHDAATSGNVVNEVKLQYNGFGRTTTEYQAHGGSVDDEAPGVSPNVQYSYTDASNNHTRLTKITYPNGRYLHCGYDSGEDDDLGRVSWLADDNGSGSAGTHLAEYTYLGLGRAMKVDFTEPDLRYDLDHGTAGDYDGIDRFGRVVDLLWRDYGSSADAVRIKHGYDRASNRLYREDDVAANQSPAVHLDELYTYDAVYRLTDLERGNLNANKDDIVSGTEQFAEEWGLDPLGNWSTFKQDTDGDGDWDLDQTRDHNKANEIDEIDDSSTHVAHDAAGNMTKTPKPDDWSAHYNLTYDAWNRLVKVEDGEDTVAEYQYDGLNRRTLKKVYASGSLDHTRHFYYSNGWQVLEERVDTSTDADRQFVWGTRYVDDLILRDRDAGEGGDLGKTGSGLDERLYAMQDPNWNVVALFGEVESTWQAWERYMYQAYGKSVVLAATFANRSCSNFDAEYRFTGRRLLKEAGLLDYRSRCYHAASGRFLQRDSLEYDDGPNVYAYVHNGPLTATDPDGTADPGGWVACTKKHCDDCVREGWTKKKDTALDTLYKMLSKYIIVFGKPVRRGWKKGCKPNIVCCDDNVGKCDGCANKDEFGYNPKGTQDIAICAHNSRNYEGVAGSSHGKCGHMWETLRHELTHLLDSCTGYDRKGKNKCELCLCDELRAYTISGQCKRGSVWWELNPFANELDCLYMSAKGSCGVDCYFEFAGLNTDAKIKEYIKDVKKGCKFYSTHGFPGENE